MNTKKELTFTLLVGLILNPTLSISQEFGAPYDQEFVLTAYYSPLPDQCCYVKGNYDADRILNGNGTHGADGTPVYPGMLAAPPAYAFGTRVTLPGLGILTVHDRGGAIQELENGAHRLDVWAGHGEEGLARALAFGVKRMKGRVYPTRSEQPAESFALADLPAPLDMLEPYVSEQLSFVSLHSKAGDRSVSVKILQENLALAGYFTHAATGLFGPVTQQSLESFIQDHGLSEPAGELTELTAAYLAAAVERTKARAPIATFVAPGDTGRAVLQAQRTLRFLGYYRGRTNGQYGESLRQAILAFQKDHALIGSDTSPGAGRIGPQTTAKILAAWKVKHVRQRAEKILALHRIDEIIASRGEGVTRFFGSGERGEHVRALQKTLASSGFFPADQINGYFGPLTADALIAFQIDRGIIDSPSARGAGHVGPATVATLRTAERQKLYLLVRAEGWAAL